MTIRKKYSKRNGTSYIVSVNSHRRNGVTCCYYVGTYHDAGEAKWVNDWMKKSVEWDKEILKEREATKRDAETTPVPMYSGE